MPKVIQPREFDEVESWVVRVPGIGITALAERLGIPRRTLQRRLHSLIAAGRITARGRGRALQYYPSGKIIRPLEARTPTATNGATTGTDPVPLSTDGAQIRALVRRPISVRFPVGYKREFIARYKPNRTSYLPGAVRENLHRMGSSPAARRPAGTYARNILDRLLVDLSWASSRLEGNTYTRLDTQNLIELGQAAEAKDALEAQMILNHKAAIEMLVDNADEIGFDRRTFLNLHALLSDNLLTDPNDGGRLRTHMVEVAESVFLPLNTPQQIQECFDLLLAKAAAIDDPFEQAFFVMVHVPYLQPFADVNKRVSRVGANISLIKHNLSPLSFVDVPDLAYIEGVLGVYELNRVELLRDVFVWAYERSCARYVAIKESQPEPDPLRLRYAQALRQVVGEIVRKRHAIDTADIRRLAHPLVAGQDLQQFVAMVFNDLHHLHDGNIARYRLRLSEFQRWAEGRIKDRDDSGTGGVLAKPRTTRR